MSGSFTPLDDMDRFADRLANKAYEDPNHPGNKIRPNVRCSGCGKLGCVTYWGPWCFECNVERINRINGRLGGLSDELAQRFG